MNTPSPRRALILIDVQNEYVTGGLPIEYPPVADSLARIAQAIQVAQAAAIPIVVVQQMAPADYPVFAVGSPGWELHPVVAALSPARLVQKALPSALAGTGLGDWLREQQIDTLTVAGYMTQNCNESTIRQAAHEGWQVEFLHDASGAISYRNRMGLLPAKTMHEAACVVIQSRFAAVLSTDEWAACVQEQRAPERDNIYQSRQRAHGAA